MHSPPVFIIGAQRSGTTLLRLMLNAHSQLAIPEEGTFWMPILRDCRRSGGKAIDPATLARYLAYIRKNAQFRLWDLPEAPVAGELLRTGRVTPDQLMSAYYAAYSRQQGKARWGDKSPTFFRMVPVLAGLFPGARFIHLVRDGRDNYLSWQKMGIQRRTVGVGAFEWRHKVGRARADLARWAPDRTIEVRYEDLVTAPNDVLTRISRFIDLPFEAGMVEFWRRSDRYIGRHHSETIFSPVTADRVGRWQRNLTPAQVARFEAVAGRCLRESGYPLTTSGRPTLRTAWGIGLDILSGLPGRLFRVFRTAAVLGLASRLGIGTRAAGAGEETRRREVK